jgi:hypothetical protein
MNPRAISISRTGRDEASKTKFRLVLIYEETVAGKYARRFGRRLAGEMKGDCEVVEMIWSFDVLAIPEIGEEAAAAADGADLVVFSISSQRAVPAHLHAWVDKWMQMTGRPKPAVAVLTDEFVGGDTPTGLFLRARADAARLHSYEQCVAFETAV